MSNFQCEKCGAYCWDTETGYISGCQHYPPDRRPTPWEVEQIRNVAEFWIDLDSPYLLVKNDERRGL